MTALKNARRPAKKTAAKDTTVDSTAEFEQLLSKAPGGQRFVLHLYVTGHTVRSSQAVANVRFLCEEYLAGRYDLEVVDIYQQPNKAAQDQVIAAPTLIKKLPLPIKRMIGDLSDRDKVIVGLNLADEAGGRKDKTRWVKL